MMTEFSIERLRQDWPLLPNIRVRYSEGESGWAKDVGGGRVVIANTPIEERLHFMDVVEIDENKRCGAVVWRAYEHKVAIRYGQLASRAQPYVTWRRICEALSEVRLSAESYVEGMAQLCCNDIEAVCAALRSASLEAEYVPEGNGEADYAHIRVESLDA